MVTDAADHGGTTAPAVDGGPHTAGPDTSGTDTSGTDTSGSDSTGTVGAGFAEVDAGGGYVSPRRLRRRRQDALVDRVVPSWNDDVAAGATTPIGGGLRTARGGRTQPLGDPACEVLLALALCVTALSWFGKAACLQTTTTTTPAGTDITVKRV